MYEAVGNSRKAVSMYRKALLIQPQSVEALCNLGNSLLKLGKTGEALKHLNRAAGLKQDDVETNLALSKAYRLLGRYALAGTHVQRVITAAPGNHEAYLSRGLILNAQQLYDEAVRSFSRALELKPTSVPARFNLAEAYRLNRQYGKALEMYGKVVRIESANGLAYQRMGKSICCRGSGMRRKRSSVNSSGFFPDTPAGERSTHILPSCGSNVSCR